MGDEEKEPETTGDEEKEPVTTKPKEKPVKPDVKPQPRGWKKHPSQRPIVT